jgi:hypothetical protein
MTIRPQSLAAGDEGKLQRMISGRAFWNRRRLEAITEPTCDSGKDGGRDESSRTKRRPGRWNFTSCSVPRWPRSSLRQPIAHRSHQLGADKLPDLITDQCRIGAGQHPLLGE